MDGSLHVELEGGRNNIRSIDDQGTCIEPQSVQFLCSFVMEVFLGFELRHESGFGSFVFLVVAIQTLWYILRLVILCHSRVSHRAAITCVNDVSLKLLRPRVFVFSRCVVHGFPFESCFAQE